MIAGRFVKLRPRHHFSTVGVPWALLAGEPLPTGYNTSALYMRRCILNSRLALEKLLSDAINQKRHEQLELCRHLSDEMAEQDDFVEVADADPEDDETEPLTDADLNQLS